MKGPPGQTPPWADTPSPRTDTPSQALLVMANKQAVCILLECILVTTCKQSLGQGNVFTPVCHSVHGGGDSAP